MEDSKRDVSEGLGGGRVTSAVGIATLLRNPVVVGSAGVIVGLLFGVVLGRASVGGATGEQDLARLEGRLSERPAESTGPGEAARPPSLEYRRHLGRKLPRGSRGFVLTRVTKRPVAQLEGDRSTLRFDIAPTDSSYALTSVAVVEGGKAATLAVELDGKPLGETKLSEGWGIYVIPIAANTLSAGAHELAFNASSPEGARVALESIAVVPLAPEIELPMGTGALGSMIEGFSAPSRDSVWSNGPRSALGVVIPKPEGSYRLTLRAAAISKLAPLTVSARVNGKDVGTASFEKKVGTSEWEIPTNTLQPGLNRIEFSYPQTATPSEYDPKSRDDRPLALRFYQLSLRPE